MAEELQQEVDQGGGEAAIREEALKMGWIPPEEFKGAQEKFIDAETYVERAKSFMPILRKNNEVLRGELGQTKAQLERLQRELEAGRESMQAMQEFHEEDVKRKREQAREEARRELAEARSEGDTDREASAIENIAAMGRESVGKAVEPPPPKDYTKEPDFIEWNAKNPWLGTDRVKSGLALGIMGDLREKGETSNGKVFFDKVDAQMEKFLNSRAPDASRVEGGRHSGGGGAGPQGKSYSDLPADARQACDRQGTKLVGAGRAFKTEGDWRKYYVSKYFEE